MYVCVRQIYKGDFGRTTARTYTHTHTHTHSRLAAPPSQRSLPARSFFAAHLSAPKGMDIITICMYMTHIVLNVSFFVYMLINSIHTHTGDFLLAP